MVPSFSLKSDLKEFIKIPFINKGMDFIDLLSLFIKFPFINIGMGFVDLSSLCKD